MDRVLARRSLHPTTSISVGTATARTRSPPPSVPALLFNILTATWYTLVILPESQLTIYSELNRPAVRKSPSSKRTEQMKQQRRWRITRSNLAISGSVLQLASFPVSLAFLCARKVRLARLSALVSYCNAMGLAVVVVSATEIVNVARRGVITISKGFEYLLNRFKGKKML